MYFIIRCLHTCLMYYDLRIFSPRLRRLNFLKKNISVLFPFIHHDVLLKSNNTDNSQIQKSYEYTVRLTQLIETACIGIPCTHVNPHLYIHNVTYIASEIKNIMWYVCTWSFRYIHTTFPGTWHIYTRFVSYESVVMDILTMSFVFTLWFAI